MSVTVIVGAQWGDEGKGKVVDLLTEHADIAARYGGGANAGHTLVVNGKKTVIRLVPSGILQPKPRCILGPGMVIDPAVLIAELRALGESGADVSAKRVLISEQAHVVLPYHILIDTLREATANAIGTTKRGIGPAYEDKVGRRGIRMGDLLDPARLAARIEAAVEAWRPTILALGGEVPDAKALIQLSLDHGRQLQSLIGDAAGELQDAVLAGKKIIAEGAQGSLLDIDHGTYPYVTSSTVLAGGASTGLGIGPTHIHSVVGITKAYATRVGDGPFPSELHDEVGEAIRKRGGEFGSVTGRPRRCGWIDLVALRRAARLNGLTEVIVTKADVLQGLAELKLCVAYERNGERLRDVPSSLVGVTPVYETLPGFTEDLSTIRDPKALPASVVTLIQRIEEATGVPVRWLSVGPDREASIQLF
jgi:adenylosuccinate synthase